MSAALGLLLLGIIGLYFGADFLIKGAGKLALLLGLSPLFVGLTVVSLGTSLPEFFVSVNAAFAGRAAMSLGNVVGSNVANIALVLGLAVLLKEMYVDKQVFTQLKILILFSVMFCLLCLKGQLDLLSGMIMTACFIAFLVYTYKSSPRDILDDDEFAKIKEATGKYSVLIAEIIGGGIALQLGAIWTVSGATKFAQIMGIPDAVIGATMIAFGTSLPELFTSLLAIYKGESDISIGNVLGSNVFNLFGIMGPVSMITVVQVTKDVLRLQLPAMLFITVMLWPIMYTGDKKPGGIAHKVSWREGLVMVMFYFTFVYMLFN